MSDEKATPLSKLGQVMLAVEPIDDEPGSPNEEVKVFVEGLSYQQAVIMVAMASRALAMHDLPKFLQDIEQADAVGPLFNPTLWMNKSRAMGEDREMIKAALPLWRIGKKFQEMDLIEEAEAGESELP